MSDTAQHYKPGEHPDLPPPPGTIGFVGWVKKNLFSSPANTALTVVAFYLLWLIIPATLNWGLLEANFEGTNFKECVNAGACWPMIEERFHQFFYGFYNIDQYWRPNLAFVLLFVALTPVLYDKVPHRGKLLIFSAIYPIIAFYLLSGGIAGLEIVETRNWGGFLLTLVLGVTGIVASLPLGVALALGRRSSMPFVRILCVCFIELVRGVPLITILFMASTMLPLFLPEGMTFDKLLRALVGVTLFSSAYMAEVIRGGLQAIPKGQYEAAEAMALTYWQSMRLIILPQALRIVIPGIVNTFIGLYKDTTLVTIIGLFDLLGIATAVVADADWRGLSTEAYVFVATFFFVSCFAMSRYSLWLEAKLHTGHKR